MNIPKLIKVKQNFKREHIEDIEKKVIEEIEKSNLTIKKGDRIAIAVGSRGIANIAKVVKATVAKVKYLGGEPFIIPAMGSHGGANAIGQRAVLEGYGVTEEYIGAPIVSSMEIVELPSDGIGNKVYMDKAAFEASGTIIINRIKVHTDFHSITESGLIKMCVIGLGKHKQALEIHRHRIYGLKNMILPTAKQVLKHGNIILGIGLVENAYDETAIIKAIRPEDLIVEELKLLDYNRNNMPSLPVTKLHVLMVDEMGKDISGVGIDTNIIGRIGIKGEDNGLIEIINIVVGDLTTASHGNALGMGLADFITKKLHDKIDFQATYENVITSTFLERGKMPIVAPNELIALNYALRTCGPIEIEEARIIRIKNTLKLSEIYVSKPVYEEIKDKDNIEVIGEYKNVFDSKGEFISF
ncbi:MAG TPA: DUF2088 domain-containing protein [Clostridiaceae bacterium]